MNCLVLAVTPWKYKGKSLDKEDEVSRIEGIEMKAEGIAEDEIRCMNACGSIVDEMNRAQVR